MPKRRSGKGVGNPGDQNRPVGPLSVICPKCFAGVGRPCSESDGLTTVEVRPHKERKG